jgi:hypothetical protein
MKKIAITRVLYKNLTLKKIFLVRSTIKRYMSKDKGKKYFNDEILLRIISEDL